MKHSKIAIIFFCALGLSACGTTPVPAGLGKNNIPQLPENWQEQSIAGQVVNNWVVSFHDKALSKLVEEAEKQNRNLQVTAANVERALALNKQSAAALLPTVNLSLGGKKDGLVKGSSNAGNVNAGLQVSWEVDVWGRLAAGENAATADLQAQQLDYQFARSSLAAAVTRGYFLVKEAQQQVQINEETVATLQRILDIVKLQAQEQLVSQQDVNVAESDLAAGKERLNAVRKSERDAERSLELLLGRYPSAQLRLTASLPEVPPPPPAGLPAEILERRPDVVAAERRVAAAFNRVSEAKAALLPNLNLTSNLGGASNSLKNALDPSNLSWSLGTSLLAPIFDSGRLKAQVEAANARQKAAIASYGQKALEVFNEVETQLDANESLGLRVSNAHEAYITAEKAYKIAQLRQETGDIDLLELSQIQQRVFQRQSQWIALQRQQLDARVNLYLALGGDWN
ncbi:efflux transporter outer membrane subunit [Endozoicomonas arenosclerae]|uniref:efflux transporter outer membrane subunit n=1 Tax=Endozoicomonas arenosclerae TaxID=1633495 RepID=UPI0007825CC6|nr:efflux transporter outer membrane subunit [Endozoicomonas arenosclerae]